MRGGACLNPHNLPVELFRRRKKTLLEYFSLSIRHDGRMEGWKSRGSADRCRIGWISPGSVE